MLKNYVHKMDNMAIAKIGLPCIKGGYLKDFRNVQYQSTVNSQNSVSMEFFNGKDSDFDKSATNNSIIFYKKQDVRNDEQLTVSKPFICVEKSLYKDNVFSVSLYRDGNYLDGAKFYSSVLLTSTGDCNFEVGEEYIVAY